VSGVETVRGDVPLLLSMPHGGTDVPAELMARLTDAGRSLIDTDWWIERVYDFAADLGASVVRTATSRVVIDVNRDPAGQSLYPGQATTGLCPLETFDGAPLYAPGDEPDAAEIAARQVAYFAPYHDALAGELALLKAAHGYALLYDCHSIRSTIPRLFEGTLPVLNIGTSDGASCAPGLVGAVDDVCAGEAFSYVVDGRFKGGWITRRYGRPADGVHALQMELAQRAYMDEAPPWTFDDARAKPLKRLLRRVLEAMLAWGADNFGRRP